MLELRKLQNEDIIQLNRIWTIVYNMRRDYSKEDEKKEPDPLEHPADWAWGVFDGKKLLAGMYEIDYLMRFDGHSVKMSGISGVGTLPEARKGGHVRNIFAKLLPQAYENGVVFSNLTPFNHDFYRKFGYEVCCARKNISITTGDFEIKPTGQFVHIQPGDDFSDLAQVHSAYIQNINHGIHRGYWPEDRAWKIFTRDDPCATGKYLYLWKDENDKPRGYIKYEDVMEDGEHHMSVTELVFTDIKGLYGTLGITALLSAQFVNFKWQMPSFLDSFDLINDAWSVEQHEYRPKDMTRVVNVKKALELMRRPYADCEFVLEVKDESLPVNSGKYFIKTGPGGSEVSITTRNADLSCDILTLSQLITGYRTFENALYTRRQGLEAHGNIDVLKRVFTERPQHVTEYF